MDDKALKSTVEFTLAECFFTKEALNKFLICQEAQPEPEAVPPTEEASVIVHVSLLICCVFDYFWPPKHQHHNMSCLEAYFSQQLCFEGNT